MSRPGHTRRQAQVGDQARYACGWAPHFAAAALVRSDPGLGGQPVAVMTGPAATWMVFEVTAEAWGRGVRPGMSLGAAVTCAADLVCRSRDLEAERSAAAALLDAALATSPRVEVIAPESVLLDLAGLDGVLGDEPRIGQRLADAIAELDLPAHVGIGGTRTAAALAARTAPGVTVVPRGGEQGFLAPLPVALLDPASDLAEALDRWGIRTLGELAALPAAGVLARLGTPGTRLQALARGQDDRPFVTYVPAEPCVEALALDWEVASLEALAFVLRRLLDRLCARLAVRDLGTRALYLTARLADGGAHTRRLGLVAPVGERRTLLDLLLTDLEEVRLPAPIVALSVEAETTPLASLQSDLFAPPVPSPRELGETLGRLAALVGPDRVGAPILGDTHRPDAFSLAPFMPAGEVGGRERPPGGGAPAGRTRGRRPSSAGGAGRDDRWDSPPCRKAAVAAMAFSDAAALVCRRFTPPLPADVGMREGEPRHVGAAGVRGSVVASAGPWRTAGAWWADTAWSREEWDVALSDGAVYRLVRNRATGAWTVDAVYD